MREKRRKMGFLKKNYNNSRTCRQSERKRVQVLDDVISSPPISQDRRTIVECALVSGI